MLPLSSRRQRLIALFVAAATALGPGAAAAEPQATDAKELAAAEASARAKNWDEALAHYQAALRAAPSARAQLGLADALYRLGRLGEAYAAYDDAQRMVPKLQPADATMAAARLKELAPKTGWLSVRVSEAGAQVELDGKPLGTSPVPALVRVVAGAHALRVTLAGFVPFEGRPDVSPDGKAVAEATLVREATQGHVVVQTTGEALRVLVDGVDVGATPWEADLPPGPHEVSGRSSTAIASSQSITVTAGARTAVDLVPMSTAAHLQIRTNDGQGLITLDGLAKGTGAFAGDVNPGVHTVAVTRDGYQAYQKTLTLGPRETAAETVTLQPLGGSAGSAKHTDRPEGEGVYGSFGLAWLPGVGGMGTELETSCGTLGAASCDTPLPTESAGVFGYVGWTWNPVGFEIVLAAAADTVVQKATFDGKGGTSGTLPTTSPARVEKFTLGRFGGFAALRVRASYSFLSTLRGTLAGGLGFSYKEMLMKREAAATDGSGLHETYVPDALAYISPGISLEGALHIRFTPALALAVGAEFWGENASVWGNNASPPSPGHALSSGQSVVTAPIPTPQYHFASGTQVFLGPFLGLQFGP